MIKAVAHRPRVPRKVPRGLVLPLALPAPASRSEAFISPVWSPLSRDIPDRDFRGRPPPVGSSSQFGLHYRPADGTTGEAAFLARGKRIRRSGGMVRARTLHWGLLLILALVLVGALMAFTACGEEEATDYHRSDRRRRHREGDRRHLARASDDGPDAAASSHLSTTRCCANMYDALVSQNDTGQPDPSRAWPTWTILDDGMAVEFKLKEGVKFHSGDPLTSADVIFSHERSHGQQPRIRGLHVAGLRQGRGRRRPDGQVLLQDPERPVPVCRGSPSLPGIEGVLRQGGRTGVRGQAGGHRSLQVRRMEDRRVPGSGAER